MLELVSVVHGQGGHDIESALGLGVHHAGDLLQTLHQRVAPSLVLLTHSGEILRAHSVQSGGADLVDGGGAKTALAPFHGVTHKLLVAGDKAADAGAAGGKALGNGVDDDDVVLVALQLQKAHQRLTAVDEFPVDLVADDEEVVLFGNVGHEFYLVFGKHGAGGVAGVSEHDGPGVLVNAGLHALAYGELVALLRGSGDGAHGCAGKTDEGAVIGIEGFGNDDLVALVQNAAENYL